MNLNLTPAFVSFSPMIHIKEESDSNSSSGSNSFGESSDVHLSIFPSNIFLTTPPLKVDNPKTTRKVTNPYIKRKVANPNERMKPTEHPYLRRKRFPEMDLEQSNQKV